MKKLTVICLLAAASLAPAGIGTSLRAQSSDSATTVSVDSISPEKRAEIEKNIRISGKEKMMRQVLDQMIPALQKAMPKVSEDFWTKFR